RHESDDDAVGASDSLSACTETSSRRAKPVRILPRLPHFRDISLPLGSLIAALKATHPRQRSPFKNLSNQVIATTPQQSQLPTSNTKAHQALIYMHVCNPVGLR